MIYRFRSRSEQEYKATAKRRKSTRFTVFREAEERKTAPRSRHTGGVGRGRGFLLGLGHLDVGQGVVAVDAYEVDIAFDAGAVARLGVLPEGEACGGVAAVVGDEDVVLGVFLVG